MCVDYRSLNDVTVKNKYPFIMKYDEPIHDAHDIWTRI
jgi:hypothetical protein